MNDESAIPIIVFMRPSQNSIIVQWPKTVKAIRGALSSRHRTPLGRKLTALGYLRDTVFTEMARIIAKLNNAGADPVGKSHLRIARRPKVLRIKFGVLVVFGAAFAFSASSPANSAQQSAGAGSPSQAASVAGPDATAPSTSSLPVSAPKLSDFAWLEGRWRGDWGPRVAEQVWTAPKAGMMLGDFRVIENDKVLVIELFTLVEKPGGINFYVRHFTPELVPWEKSDATLLNLATAEAKKFDFENPVNSRPKRAIFTHLDNDTYTWRSEILPEKGDPQIIEITYHRQPLAAATPNPGAGKKK
jgi:hypothetical protein